MMTARKKVGLLLTHRLVVRHSVDYSSLDHFSSDDSSSSSSSETSSDSSTYALSGIHGNIVAYSSNHSLPASASGTRASHRLCSLVLSVHRSSTAIFERPSHDSSSVTLSFARADLLPSPKRFRSPELATDLEDSSAKSSEPSRSKGTDLEMDVDVERSDGIDIDPEIQADIDECIAYADALRDRGIDVRVLVEAIIERRSRWEGAVEVTYETLGDLVQRFRDHTKEIPVRRVQLEQDNRILKDMMDVASQRVARSQRRELRVQREMRQIWTMPNTRSGASRICEGINEQIDCRLAGTLGARDAARNLEPLMGDGGEAEEVNGNRGNRNGGNGNKENGNGGNGNGNGGGYGYNFRGFMPARECTYQDFLKCQPLNFNRTEGVVRLTRWFDKMEMVFHISNCPEKYQVKYVMATLLNSALTWNEVQKMETELWNLAVKGNDLTAYTRRFQELVLLCTRMVPNEEDKVERFVGGLPDNIQGNVIAAGPTKLQDAIRIANNLMDQKLKGYARSAENKRRLENNPRDNRGKQPVFKRQNVGGQKGIHGRKQ
ncbi:putative reverse transcriptase domain-containing protein [Tanacetum coccineum]